jgi:sugar phosphate isomerase/epimerase
VRLGASLGLPGGDPEEAALAYVERGFSAAACSAASLGQPEHIRAICEAFRRYDVILAEVGVWNNMLHPDPVNRRANVEANARALALADEAGALCCVNTAGSLDELNWMGPHAGNLSEEAFHLTVQNVRTIIDAVKPKTTYYTLEPMPWVIPDSPDCYVDLIGAVDRPMFGVHLDPVNMINSPSRYYGNAEFLRECFSKLGRWIVSCHGKDITLRDRLTVHLDEVRPGLGALDYEVFLRELGRLPGDVPLLLEHLPQDEYPAAREYVIAAAERIGLAFHTPVRKQ